MNLSEKAEKIKVIVLDVDGVMTDGRFGYDSTGNEIKNSILQCIAFKEQNIGEKIRENIMKSEED